MALAPVRSPIAGRILVADDHEMNREITTAMLTLAGHEVDVVVDGAQAVAAVRQQAYDLVLNGRELGGGSMPSSQMRRSVTNQCICCWYSATVVSA